MSILATSGGVVIWAAMILLRSPAVGVFHDDGIYLVTAKSLATGEGYRIQSLPGAPLQTKYPVLFPFFLSVVWRAAPVFPGNLLWLRLVPFVAGVSWLVLSWRVIRRSGASTEVAALAVMLTAASPWSLFLSTTLLSETLFAVFVAGGVLLLARTDSRDQYISLAAGALMGAAVLTRTAGAAPAAAGAIVLAMRRQWGACGRYLIASSVVSLPWFLWSAAHAADPIADPFYSGANYRSWNIIFNYSWEDKLAIAGVNAFWATQFGQFWGLPLGTWPGWVAAATCSVWILRGLWLERRSAPAIVCVAYIALLLAWAFPPLRFMVPVLPFLAWHLFVGAGRARPLALMAGSLLVVSATLATRDVARASEARGGTWFNADQVDDWRGIQDLYEWIANHTAPDAVVVATHDPTFYLFTGRRAIRPDSMDPLMLYYNVRGRSPEPKAETEAFRQRLLRVAGDYVVVTPRDSVATIEALSSQFPGSLTLAHGSIDSRHAILRVNRERLSSTPPGAAILAR
jgi:hypothetical protein